MTKKLTNIYLFPLIIIISINTVISLISTTFFTLYQENEFPYFQKDHVWILISALVMYSLLLYFIYKKRVLERLSLKILSLGSLIYVTLICSCVIYTFHCGAACDAGHVNEITKSFMVGDYATPFTWNYLQIYPFQIEMAAYFQLIYSIFGVENFLAFQVINTICVVLVMYLLQRITYEIFENELLVKWEVVISLLLWPFFLFVTLVYGDIPGFTLAVCAVYFTIRYIKSSAWKYVFFIGLCFLFGIPIKENNAIFLVAFLITMVLKIMQDKTWKPFVAALLVLVMSQMGARAIDQYYISKAGLPEMLKGTPKISWMVMGIQYTDETGHECGWYNGFNMNVFMESNGDYEVATQKSVEALKEAAIYHLHHPRHAVKYYYHKFVSQWNDPTFQSQLMNEWYSRHVKQTKAWEFFNYGFGRKILYHFMNIFHFIVFFFLSIGGWMFLRQWNLPGAYVLLNTFGGMMFHELVWESKGRYILPYYVIMIPFAALGIYCLVQWLDQKLAVWRERRHA